MRLPALAALLTLVACAPRARPYRFSSPLLGGADVPAAVLPGRPAPHERGEVVAKAAHATGRGWQHDAQAGAIRSVSARGIELTMPTASAEAATAVAHEGYARDVVWSRLPAPNVDEVVAPTPREPSDLRALIGTRDKRDPFAIVAEWLAELNLHIEGSDGAALVAWAGSSGKLGERTEVALPGDLLVFDHAVGDDRFDLVGLAIARDGRGVTEFLYAGGGVIRRGFFDPTRAAIRRDGTGLVVNTFLRHGKKWPPKGTRYLAAELLSNVIHVH